MLTQADINRLEAIASEQRLHVCSDGYRWQISPRQNDGWFIGTVWSPDGREIHRVEALTHYKAEERVLKHLTGLRATY